MRRLRLKPLPGIVLAIAACLVAGCGNVDKDARPGAAETAVGPPAHALAAADRACGHRPAGRIQRVVWIVMENKAYGDVIGSTDAPYLNRLAKSCGLATNFRAESHPSLPNYLAMTSGSTHGITDDANPSAHPLRGPSIFSQVGRWRAVQESMPRPCQRANRGTYAVRHNPPTYYTSLAATCNRLDVPMTGRLDVSAPFTFITPNKCNDMHDCSVRTGDRWIARWLPRILATPEYRSGSLAVFITWDEDDRTAQQHIPTLVVSPGTPQGARSATPYNHYSMLRTTEEVLGLPKLGAAAQAPSMRSAFGLG